jgi:hypothetical protein
MYFPVPRTLGYSHGLILYAPFYLLARVFFDPLPAYNVTVFLVMETGALCLYLICRKFAKLGFIESLLLSAFFFSSGNLINGDTGVWTQRASVFLIPPILLTALVSARMPKSRYRAGLAWLSGLLLGLLFTQDFYTAAFAVLIAGLLLPGLYLLARRPAERRDSGQEPRRPSPWWLAIACVSLVAAIAVHVHPIARSTVGPLTFSATDPIRPLLIALLTGGWFAWRRWDVPGRLTNSWNRDPYTVAFTLGGLAGCVVFFWIYSAAYREHPAFPEEQLTGALEAIDLSRAEWRSLAAYESLRTFKLVLVVVILAWVPWFRIEKAHRLYCLWFLFVTLIVLMIPLRFDEVSLWKTLLAPLPGFSAIRDPKRIIEVYELAVVLLAVLFLMQLPRTSRFRVFVSAVVFLLLWTEWNRNVLHFARPTSVYRRWVQAPIDVDASCQSFFIKGASDAYMSRSFHKWGLYAMDSMFISLDRSIPTLNGYSAWWPDRWGLADPHEPGYSEAVGQWIARHQLRDVCELDIEARTMKPYVPAAAVR